MEDPSLESTHGGGFGELMVKSDENGRKKHGSTSKGDEEAFPLAEREQAEYDEFVKHFDDRVKNLAEGEIVRGRVLQITPSEVVVDVGFKSEGVVNAAEFLDYSGQMTIKEGDEVDVLIERTEDMSGYVRLSREKAEKMKVWDLVDRAFRAGTPIKGRVIDRIKGGLAVDIGVKAFLPGSLIDIKPAKNLDAYRGREIEVKVINLDKKRGNIVLSRRAVLEVEYEEKKRKTLESLHEREVLRGFVKNLTDYGAFIDLGGMDGLLHISDMSYGRLGHPSEIFKVGDEVDVIVLKFDPETERVSLGHKQLFEDPWLTVLDKYPIDSRVVGRVVNLTDYGAFVALEDGVEGLIHVSEMSWTKKVKNPSKLLNVGDEIECIVSDVNMDQRRISLSLRAAEPNPWEAIAEKYPPGSRIKGIVRNLTDFGAFVEIEEGIDGLVHISDMSWTRRVKHPSEIVKKGDTVEAKVSSVDIVGQRISLSMKDLLPDEWERFANNHSLGETMEGDVVSIADFGVFVRLENTVEGLVHISEIDRVGDQRLDEMFRVDDRLLVRIIKVDREERRIGLTYLEKISAAPEPPPEAASPRKKPRKKKGDASTEEEAPASAEGSSEEA
jgi:small subunit ribosomal protein S1